MKRFAQILCAVVGIASAYTFIIEYIGGRQGLPLSIGGFPAQIVSVLASVLSIFLLVVTLFVALIRRKAQRAVSSMMGLAILLFILTFTVIPARIFQIGFRARIQSTITPDELRQIGTAVHNTLLEDGRLPGPGNNRWNEEDHGAQWQVLVKTTRIENLDPWMVIFKHSNTVELTWGGALVGHWGLVIDTCTKQHSGDIAKGIRTFITSD